MTPRCSRSLASSLLLVALTGCGTIESLGGRGPFVFGGVRQDVEEIVDPGWFEFPPLAALDLPFSALLDTALLPVTIGLEIRAWLRRGRQWPPSPRPARPAAPRAPRAPADPGSDPVVNEPGPPPEPRNERSRASRERRPFDAPPDLVPRRPPRALPH